MADHFFGITDTGKLRDNNEDTFIAQEVWSNKFILACVIDGVGGYSGGEIAAAIARETIIDYYDNQTEERISMMKESFMIANEKIYAEKQLNKEHGNMACVLTLALVDIEKNQFHYAHLGDTRLYLLRDHSLVKISKDHSFVGFLEDSGRLTEEEAMKHPKRNEINKALGFGGKLTLQEDYIETGESPFLPGDMLLLCSDGLTDLVTKSDITSILNSNNSLEEKATQLVAAANKNGGKDNITAVLVQNNKTSQTQEATRPANSQKKNDEISAISQHTHIADNPASVAKPKSRNGLIALLSILTLVFLITSLGLLWQRSKQNSYPADTSSTQKTPPAETRNSQEIKLQNAINTLTGDTLILTDSAYPQPIIISDTLLIQKDSLYIKAKGHIVLVADSTYAGPAILLASQCKYILMDSLIFKNFETGIVVHNNVLNLKNVRFNNCRIPVRTLFTFSENQYVNGGLLDHSFKMDSLPVSRK